MSAAFRLLTVPLLAADKLQRTDRLRGFDSQWSSDPAGRMTPSFPLPFPSSGQNT